MFGNKRLKAEIKELQAELDRYKYKFYSTVDEYNALVDRANAQRRQFERLAQSNNHTTPFNQKDIRSLIRLCHPDKHNNSESSTRLTTILLAMRAN